MSLNQIAVKIREGGRTPSIRQFAEMVVRQTGVPASQHLGTDEAAGILFQYVIDNVRYRPDPLMTEWTQSAAITLCVNGAPMCIPVEDCDGLCVALGSLLLAYGIEVRIVKQTFGMGDQEHVLIEYKTDSGAWIPLDPTPRSPQLQPGQKAVATHEDYIDPTDPSAIGMVAGTPHAEFIGVGRMPDGFHADHGNGNGQGAKERFMAFVDGAYEEVAHGKVWRRVGETWVEQQTSPAEFIAGLPKVSFINPMPGVTQRITAMPSSMMLNATRFVGSVTDTAMAVPRRLFGLGEVQPPSSVMPPFAPAPSSTFTAASTLLANQMTAPIAAGDTYMTEATPDFAQAVSSYQAAGQAGATSVGPSIDLSGASAVTQPYTQRAWRINAQLAVIPTTGATLVDAQQAQTLVKQMQSQYQLAIAEGTRFTAVHPAGSTPKEDQATGFGTPTAIAIGVGGVLGYFYYRNKKRGRRR